MTRAPQKNVSHVPAGYRAVTPSLTVDRGADALAFYRDAFGAEVVQRYDGADGKVMHSEIQIGDCRLMVSDEYPEMGLRAPDRAAPVSASFMLYVTDVDRVYERAIAAGARPLGPVKDEFHGDRMGSLRDPFGHRWIIATHIEDVPPEEVERRAKAWMKENGLA